MRATMAFALIGLSGCVGAGGFQAQLQQRRGEVMYLHGTSAPERRSGTVGLGEFTVEAALPEVTTVAKTGGHVVPLLFANFWEGRYRSTLGAAQVANDYRAFMKESLAEELRRGARYAFADHDADLRVDVRVAKIEMNAPIVESGDFLFLLLAWSYSTSVRAGPVDVAIDGELVVRRGGQEVLREPIRGTARTGVLRGKKPQMQDYTLAMIEGLSLAVKSLNDTVVAEVNRL